MSALFLVLIVEICYDHYSFKLIPLMEKCFEDDEIISNINNKIDIEKLIKFSNYFT
jgi:hypothetical protein